MVNFTSQRLASLNLSYNNTEVLILNYEFCKCRVGMATVKVEHNHKLDELSESWNFFASSANI